jgi:uncharacterized membrane protein
MALKTTHLDDRGYGFGHGRSEEQKNSPAAVRFPLLPALLLGLGLGGLLDGVVLHQLLQWHHVLSQLVSRRQHRQSPHQHAVGWDLP